MENSMRYSTAFEIGDYKPSDVKVKINGNQLIFKEKSAGETLIKVITLPEFVNPHTVELYLNDGSLYIEAPVMLDRLRMNYLNNVSGNSSSNEISSASSNTITENSNRDDFYNMASALLKGFESKPALEDAPTSFAITETRINQNQPSAEITYKFNVKAESQQEDNSCCLVRKPCPPPCLPFVPCAPPVLCLPAPPLPVCPVKPAPPPPPPPPPMPCCTCNRTTTMALVPLGLSKSTFSIKEIQFDNLYESSRCSSSNSNSATATATATATTTSTTCNTPMSYLSRVNRTITSYSTAPTITRNSFSEASTSFATPPPLPPQIAYTRNSFVEQSKTTKTSTTTTTGAGATAQTSTVVNTTTINTPPQTQPQQPPTKISDITYKFKLKEFRSQDIQVTFTENIKMKIHAVRQTPDARGFGNNFCKLT
jgi:hypothetical protein